MPPLPAPKQAPKPLAKSGPQPKYDAQPATAPTAAPTPRASTPEPEPSYVPAPAAEPEPSVTAPAAQEPKPKAKKAAVRPKRKLAPQPLALASRSALPAASVVEGRRLFAAPPQAVDGGGSRAPILLAVLALAGTLLLGLAASAPRLAALWPEVFVPVIRGRDTVSVVGLCLLASGLLAWAIISTLSWAIVGVLAAALGV